MLSVLLHITTNKLASILFIKVKLSEIYDSMIFVEFSQRLTRYIRICYFHVLTIFT